MVITRFSLRSILPGRVSRRKPACDIPVAVVVCLLAPVALALGAPDSRTALDRHDPTSYQWRPFDTVQRPPVPKARNSRWSRNPIDAFIAEEQDARGLQPRPEASREILLRRVYLDLTGLVPTPQEQRAFLVDTSPQAYERVVDRLLNDPRHGERWARHWMDVWRYSDWAGWSDGNQIRDSKPHIWRWRDWIVESLNADKGYDRMILEMLAADELAPLDADALRATGFLVRNYKLLSREQWMEDTLKHTAQAFLGVTIGCAKCHDHMLDPIPQTDYYRMRAIFEPHQVRTDKLPGQPDPARDGLVRVFDTATNSATYLFLRGDERHPDTNHVMEPGVPAALCGLTSPGTSGGKLNCDPVQLPFLAAHPDHREFVIHDLVAASETALHAARQRAGTNHSHSTPAPEPRDEPAIQLVVAEAKHAALLATLTAERREDDGRRNSEEWRDAATHALTAQRRLAVEEAGLKLFQARAAAARASAQNHEPAAASTAGVAKAGAGKSEKKLSEKAAKELETATKKVTEAEKQFADAGKAFESAPGTAYVPRPAESFPAVSTGRRLAFARWVTDDNNPLTARVAMNHVWLRHFGRGIVPTPADFGRNGRAPSHPQLLDWLAAEFMSRDWSMRAMHRLIVTSSAYRMSSTQDESDAALDPDNVFLWRMNSRRLEAEAVRDNLFYVTGNLDLTRGGPDIDHQLGLTSRRRSLYLRLAAEKEVEFLKIFDGPSVTECYERRPSVMPQQALALANSDLAFAQARLLAKALSATSATDEEFVRHVFQQVLARRPKREELQRCMEFLAATPKVQAIAHSAAAPGPVRQRENLVLVLFNHNDFVTVR